MAHVVLTDLVKTYGNFYAVNNVSLTVNDGEFVGTESAHGRGPVVLHCSSALSNSGQNRISRIACRSGSQAVRLWRRTETRIAE